LSVYVAFILASHVTNRQTQHRFAKHTQTQTNLRPQFELQTLHKVSERRIQWHDCRTTDLLRKFHETVVTSFPAILLTDRQTHTHTPKQHLAWWPS